MSKVLSIKTADGLHPLPMTNFVDYSIVDEFASKVCFESFSVKYVSLGCENYTVNGYGYPVKSGEYLLVNNYAEGKVAVNELSKGICIDIEPTLLSEVVAGYRRPDTFHLDISLDTFFNTSDFLENKYCCSNTLVGSFIEELDGVISKKGFSELSFESDFYYTLAEKIVLDHIPIFKQLKSIPSLKSVTKKDLFRKVNKGKECIDAVFKSGIEIASMAKEAGLSEYHFFRLFKTMYGISPYQYIIRKRLEYANSELKLRNNSITTIAYESGFSDIQAFSKSFKKYFGFSPSYLA
jgi:AraC-like DNA-binding protein